MDKNLKRLALLSFAIYSLFLILGLGLALVMIFGFKNSNAEGFEGLGLALATVILAATGFIYAAFSIVPLVLRTFSLKFPLKKVFPAICIMLDLVFSAVNINMLLGVLTNENRDITGILFFALLLALSIVSFAVNIIYIVLTLKEDKTNIKK